MQTRELSESKLHRAVLKEECNECNADPRGKRCIHYIGCKKEVQERYTEQNPIRKISRFEGIIEYIG